MPAEEEVPQIPLVSAERPQENTVLRGGVYLLASCALWFGFAFGVLTPQVLGTSFIATALITVAWPSVIVLAGLGVRELLGLNIYSSGTQKQERARARASASSDDPALSAPSARAS